MPAESRSKPAPAWVELHRSPSGTSYLSLPAGSLLNRPASTGMGFWSINPYVGCEFGCAYCYARETHKWAVERMANRRGGAIQAKAIAAMPASEAFERRILVKGEADDALRKRLAKVDLGGAPIVFGSATDPYQPAERRFGITRKLLQALLSFEGFRIGIITKSALVRRDVALLSRLSRRHAVTVHVSLASTDRELLRRIEPRTPAPHARLRAVAALTTAGVHADIFAMPMLPGLTDSEEQLAALMAAAKQAGAAGVHAGPLRMGPATRNTLLPWLERHRPELAARYRSHFATSDYVSASYRAALDQRVTRLRTAAGFSGDGTLLWQPAQGELFRG